jgi:ZIP family zinc transporter
MINNNSIFPLILSLIAGLSTVIGAIVVFITRTKNDRFLTFALGFSAGVMLTVSFTDLLPTAENSITQYQGKVKGILWSILFLLIGALMAYLIDIFIFTEEKN